MTNGWGGNIVEVDSVDEAMWGRLLQEFDDASAYQSWPWGVVNWGRNNLSHLVMRKDGVVIAMAQISVRRISVLGGGFARVFWGPLWRRKERQIDYAVLDRMIEALKDEYVSKRGFLLRIWPVAFENSEERTAPILQKYGFSRNARVHPYRTLLLDLRPSVEDLRRNLSGNWRKHLSKAEKTTLKLVEGTEDELYDAINSLYEETLARKQFIPGIDIGKLRVIQNRLPDALKMRIMICEHDNRPVAALVGSALGDTGIEFVAATGRYGLELGGSYLLRWHMIQWLKEKGCQWYDLGGIDPSGNPGVYQFKHGMAGKNGKEITHLGQFYLADNPISHMLSICIDRTYHIRKKLRGGIKVLSRKWISC